MENTHQSSKGIPVRLPIAISEDAVAQSKSHGVSRNIYVKCVKDKFARLEEIPSGNAFRQD